MSVETITIPPEGSPSIPIDLQCMEIWGGNDAIDNAVSVPGVDVWVVSRPHQGDEQGGDIHYVSTCMGGRVSRFVMADISGHGTAVAGLAQTLRSLMRENINTLSQTRFLRSLNESFGQASKAGTFATALMAGHDATDSHLLICNAGHPSPVWYQVETKTWRFARHDMSQAPRKVHNLPLGIVAPTSYYQFAVPLGLGDLVLMYTDWLIEATDPQGAMLGEHGLLELLEGLDATRPDVLCERVIERVTEYRGGAGPDDDLSLMLLRNNAKGKRRPSAGECVRVLGKVLGLVPV